MPHKVCIATLKWKELQVTTIFNLFYLFFFRFDDSEAQKRKDFQRRNMLMNIILRPGGGDKTRALPRPKVDVRADGPNVIIIRMTFPDNENIQGLRAFTPTETDNRINEILPPNTSVERITAQSGEEVDNDDAGNDDYNYEGDYEDYNYNDYGASIPQLNRPVRQPPKVSPQGFFATDPIPASPVPTIPPTPASEPLTRPTRPPRKHKIVHLPPQPPKPPGPPPKGHKRPRLPKSVHPPPPPIPPKRKFQGLLKDGKKAPKLYIKSSLKAGSQNFDYNVAVDRQDWKPIPSDLRWG